MVGMAPVDLMASSYVGARSSGSTAVLGPAAAEAVDGEVGGTADGDDGDDDDGCARA